MYRILDADALPKSVRERVDVFIKGLKTGEEAEAVAGKDGWGYQKTFIPGSVGILTYNGIEVALYYKRHSTPVESEECDPFPQSAIKDPKDVWVRIEFLHTRPSADRQAFFMDREKELQQKITLLEGTIQQRTQENELLYAKLYEVERNLEEQTQLAERYRQRLIAKQPPTNKNQKKGA